jgi:hypothetical protein
VRKKLREKEESQWKKRIKKKSKLRFYCKIKTRLRLEDYLLNLLTPKLGRYIITSLRSGTNKLRIETGRYVDEKEEVRVCEMCHSGEIEDERHFLVTCRAYEDQRAYMYEAIRVATKGNLNFLKELDMGYIIKFLIGEGDFKMRKNVDLGIDWILVQKIVGGYVLRAMQKRARRLGSKLL